MQYPALEQILNRLNERIASDPVGDRLAGPVAYDVPGLWLDPFGPVAARSVAPERFFRHRLQAILAQPPQERVQGRSDPGDWSERAIAYNLFVRAAATWDHDGDGRINVAPDKRGWRETGTFLKAITLLPFIRSLGCNTVHLLPVTAIGRDGKKGSLGSPFAIRDPYTLDENLSEPALGLTAEVEFAAFVEAAHHLGLRVVIEFVFRTAARDSVWAGEHPEWFYWIRADIRDRQPGVLTEDAFGAPLFTSPELEAIYRQVATGEHRDLLPPHAVYRRMFLPPPKPQGVHLVAGGWLGRVQDPVTGAQTTVRIPGAFSDWTPDSDQPPWSDVTYLRLYDHPDFNYMAYNTVRIYDAQLAQPAHAVASLWDRMTEVIPYYQQAFNVDGVMIDMGHALPPALKQRIVARAREVNSDFALWAEDFQLKASSRAEGYNVCLGPFIQTVRECAQIKAWLAELERSGVPVPFMATPENHNTPRAVTWPGDLAYAVYALTLGALLPSVPYIHGGVELAEPHPINTGFDFTPEELALLPPETLPLFSAVPYGWTRGAHLLASVRRVSALRQRYANLLSDSAAGSIHVAGTDNANVIAFARRDGDRARLLVVANSDMHAPQAGTISFALDGALLTDCLTGQRWFGHEEGFAVDLAPAEVRVFELEGAAS